jgi:hypothetical protein
MCPPDKRSKSSVWTKPRLAKVHCNAAQRQYEAPWSFLRETMWSLILPRAKGISGPEKFWSSPQEDFFNTIGTFRTSRFVECPLRAISGRSFRDLLLERL